MTNDPVELAARILDAARALVDPDETISLDDAAVTESAAIIAESLFKDDPKLLVQVISMML